MADIASAFVRKSCSLLTADYLPKITRSVERLDDELVWRRPNAQSNSVGNLLLHLSGNVTQWIVGGVGQRPYQRRRDEEFAARGPIASVDLMRRLRAVVAEADEIIAGLDGTALLSRRRIQGYDVTVLDAVYHVVEHFGMHTGQIILLAKMYTGADLGLWEPPD